MSKELEAFDKIENIADKLADWNGIDICELDEEYDYSNLFINVRKALTKLETIEILVDKKKFNTNDIELLRSSIKEVLERDE